MSLKETEEGDKDVERDAEVENVTEPPADEKVPVVETSPVKPASQTPTPAPRVKREVKPIKSGLEAADIVQDALQLNLDDELNEDVRHFKPSSRSDTSLVKQNGVLDLRESSKRSSKGKEKLHPTLVTGESRKSRHSSLMILRYKKILEPLDLGWAEDTVGVRRNGQNLKFALVQEHHRIG